MTQAFPLKRFLMSLALAALTMGAMEKWGRAEAPSFAIDVDQLAGRMKKNVDLYRNIRDQALATYTKLHAGPNGYDADARQAIRLVAYLWIWGDFYREGLWPLALDDADRAIEAGCDDPLVSALRVYHLFESKYSSFDHEAQRFDVSADQLAGTDYPAAFKFWYYRIDAQNLVAGNQEHSLVNPKTIALIPAAVDKASKAYCELIKAHLASGVLFDKGRTFLHGLRPDETSLKSAATAMEQSFARDDPENVARPALQGDYNIEWAWAARGTGSSNEVTGDGWKLFGDRLQIADGILEKAYAQHPGAGIIAREMLSVELGQGQGRDRMELWFGRAVQADPDDFEAYREKAYYLAPKWYGSDEEVWNFGLECAKTQKWSAKIPLVLVDSIVSNLGQKHPEYFTEPDKWQTLESVFRGYLNLFPRSTYYRSIFARWAVEGQHWAIAEEQFKILGDQWDRVVFPGERYPQMRDLADTHAATGP